ncbi:MAG: hypothetical protein WC979_03200 [Candidatus Pacearchaeota archaeon]|jgi:hypothetical protein|nr:hypothetical protein [Clostridia bacterium]
MSNIINSNGEKYHDNFLHGPLDVQVKNMLESFSGTKIEYEIDYNSLYLIIYGIKFELAIKGTIRLQLYRNYFDMNKKEMYIGIENKSSKYNLTLPINVDVTAKLTKFFKNLEFLKNKIDELRTYIPKFIAIRPNIGNKKFENLIASKFVHDAVKVNATIIDIDNLFIDKYPAFDIYGIDKRINYRMYYGIVKVGNEYTMETRRNAIEILNKNAYSNDIAGMEKQLKDVKELQNCIDNFKITEPDFIEYFNMKSEIHEILNKIG